MSNVNPAVRLDNLTKCYPSSSQAAVEAISFQLDPGEILALLGPNGAGKTTTVKMAAGLILPTSGQVHVMGHDVVRKRTQAVRHIGAVLEGARNLYWRLSARENLRYFGSLRLVPPRLLAERAADLLKLMELDKEERVEVRHFSRGMQQKLAIAAALIHDPEVLLLDEPTLGLDLQAARKVEETVLRLARQEGKAVLLTTHTMPLAERLADRIFVIHRGRQVAYDMTHRLLEEYDLDRNTTEVRTAELLPEPLQGQLENRFSGLLVTPNGEETRLTWPEAPQSEVIGLLEFLDDQGITILDVGRRRANLEEVFLALTEEEAP